ncbi:MAG: hypothetical protein ACTSWA_05410 [Candidatus Thorarchaeota archaeon]
MYTRKRIYDRLRKLSKSKDIDNPLFVFYSEVMTLENTGSMVEHFQNMVEAIIENGTAIPISEHQMTKRKLLGLPEIKFDKDEIKKIIKKYNEGEHQ